ncbi:TRAP transporter small permease [Microbulbifer sp. S227A]|uniref:TRAP transporter small permease n=1 Tax=Microbulbifer sp. S227A TaxID=3415131 RepID=UPI003C797B1A
MVGQLLDTFCNGLRVLLGCLMALLAVPVGMQVISRYTGIIPTFLWTEELATFIFVWVVMIGSMVAIWDGTHFDVVITPDAKSPLGTLIQTCVVYVFITIFAMLFAWYGIEYAKVGSIQSSVMMRVNLLWTYITVPIAGIVWASFSAYRLYEAFATYKNSKRTAS